MPRELLRYLPLLVVVLIVARRAGRSQKVRVDRMWITPLLTLVAVGSALAREPMPGVIAIGLFILALAAGGVAGYFRALHQQLSIDPDTGQVSSKATPIGTILVVTFLILRFGMDYALTGRFGTPRWSFARPTQHSLDIFRLADAALLFTTAMMLAQRIETFRRAHLLLRGRRAA
ncbi:MAG: DUF1453 family protein [Alphaproteobacteria bacterium]|nr:DUF1453 family protein [Alphaproteobacteria bacterium]